VNAPEASWNLYAVIWVTETQMTGARRRSAVGGNGRLGRIGAWMPRHG
jgi:hypothetical protein